MMNSALKPVSSQSPSVQNQLNKPMHPQGSPAYSQPAGHMSQNPFPNINVAHNHPNAQQNHFSLNVPSAAPLYNIGSIPPSNHPVANPNQTATGLQSYTPPKTVSYSGSYQPNLGHPPNQSALPPVSQTLPASPQSQTQQQPQQTSSSQSLSNSSNNCASTTEETSSDKPQSNGTPEISTSTESQGNHVPSQSSETDATQPQPQNQVLPSSQTSPQTTEKPIESPKPTSPVQEQKPPPEPAKVPEEEEATPSPTPPPPAVPETDPLAIEASEPIKPTEIAESSPEKTEEQVDSAAVDEESVALQENGSESGSVTDADKDSKASEESSPEKDVSESVAEDVEAETEKTKEQSPRKESPPAKLVATPRTSRKPKTTSEDPTKSKAEPKTPAPKSPSSGKIKRQRIRTQPYQSPLPEIEMFTKISSTPRGKGGDDKLIYFYKNEFLAVRNAEGGFYLCQAVQNIYKSSSKIKIRWLSQDKNDKSGEIYTPDFYDLTDFDCILTSLELVRVDKGKYRLTKTEKERTDSILQRCLAVEKGEITTPPVSEEHPDGLDLSLYKDEEQLKKKRKATKRKNSPRSPSPKKETPTKKSPEALKVRKVETKTPKKAAASTPAKKPAPTPKKPAQSEPKKAASSRASRGKRKPDIKTSPVVDQKKAKVLARIGRKTAIPASTSRSHSTPTSTATKGGKTSKPTPSKTPAGKSPSTSNAKAAITPTTTGTRRNKRSRK